MGLLNDILGSFGLGRGAASGRADGPPVDDNLRCYPPAQVRFAQARAKARATLPRFLGLADGGLRGVYLVKMRLVGGGEVENIWVEVAGLRNGRFHGRLANDPVVPGYRAGDPVEVARDDIEDWMINTGDLRFGGYSVRAMLADMPARQAEALRRQFRD